MVSRHWLTNLVFLLVPIRAHVRVRHLVEYNKVRTYEIFAIGEDCYMQHKFHRAKQWYFEIE